MDGSRDADWTRRLPRSTTSRALGARVIARPRGGDVAVFRTADDRVFALARPLPAQGRAAVAGHRLRRARRLPAAQLDDRARRRLRRRARRGLRARASRCSVEDGARRTSTLAGEPTADRAPWPRPARPACYCGVGCGVSIEHDGGAITGVRGDPDHPANFGRAVHQGQHAAPDRDAARRRAHARCCSRCVRRARGAPLAARRLGRALDYARRPLRRDASRARARQRRASTSPASS